MNWIKAADYLPPLGKYVLVHLTKDNWFDSTDQEGCKYKVVKRVLDTNAHCNPNNQRTFEWQPFGPGTYFGQEVDWWYDFQEEIKTKETK